MVVAPGTVVVAGGAAATATVNCSCIPGDTAVPAGMLWAMTRPDRLSSKATVWFR